MFSPYSLLYSDILQAVRETLFGLGSVLSLVMIFSSQTVLQLAVILALLITVGLYYQSAMI
jgi:hypothetical protein